MPNAAASMLTFVRGISSTARIYAEALPTSAAPTPAAAPRFRPKDPSRRQYQPKGTASDRLRTGQRTLERNTPQQDGQKGSRSGGERRNKRLPSVFDDSSTSAQARPVTGAHVKSFGQNSKKLPAPLPNTDWNSPLFSKPGFERLVASAPRPSSIFAPSLAAAFSSSATRGKAKAKANVAAAPATVTNAKLNLPGIKTAVGALKFHVQPGGRNILGPINNPTGVAVGSLSHNRVTRSRSVQAKDSDDKSLAAELKAARIAIQNEQIGGSYERFSTQSVLEAAGIQANSRANSTNSKAMLDAAQALAVNADLAPDGKGFIAKTIADRLGAQA
ncbi:uncharacterized protein MEPE_06433 [Melanopsichium pennsylvanicum]|uniref:Uncharacterized protein n=2 Tax=Melanopsichium pennsylvanicum TaxID=63383 RepID=A0AAJ4XST9_9BASI|nr:uncharacterized protein MEPE_06433 [Melanopsichium pennsylvanicum]